MKPRTVCGCQSVARMISATVAPLGRCSSRMTCAFLVPARAAGLLDRALLLRRVLLFAAELPSPFWSAFQMRLTAVLRSVKRLTAVAPGRLFQMRNRRAVGHGSATWPSSSRLLKASVPWGLWVLVVVAM